MKMVWWSKRIIFSGLCPSMDDQRLLKNVDKAEKVWFEYSLDLYVKI